MGIILRSEYNEDHYIAEVKLDIAEWKGLKGSSCNIYLIPEEHAVTNATFIEKGKKGSSKYLLLPKNLRENIQLKKVTPCVKIENGNKIIISYILEKSQRRIKSS
jgi:hypothetical protein